MIYIIPAPNKPEEGSHSTIPIHLHLKNSYITDLFVCYAVLPKGRVLKKKTKKKKNHYIYSFRIFWEVSLQNKKASKQK